MSRTALIVDDSNSMRQMVGLTLRHAGFDVVEGADGEQALRRLDEGPVSIVITDLNMPVMDGMTLIRAIRRRGDGAAVPILVLTTDSQAAVREQAREAGASGWILKPFDPNRLIDAVTRVLG